jgi:hypothetical protein
MVGEAGDSIFSDSTNVNKAEINQGFLQCQLQGQSAQAGMAND